jgi:hypothetical protein
MYAVAYKLLFPAALLCSQYLWWCQPGNNRESAHASTAVAVAVVESVLG